MANFESTSLSVEGDGEFNYKGPCGFEVCVRRNEIDNIILNRLGGGELLHSEARLFHLLGKGTLSVIHSDEGNPLYIVEFFGDEIDEIKRVIEASRVDISKLVKEDVTAAILKSFSRSRNGHLPPKEQCYASISDLTNEISLPINDEEFNAPVIANGKNVLPQIIKAIRGDNITVRSECIGLLFDVLTIKENPPIQRAVELGTVPLLIEFLDLEEDDHACYNSAAILQRIAKYGTCGHVQLMVDKAAIPALIRALEHKNQDIVKSATVVMGQIAKKSESFRYLVLKTGAVQPLIIMLEKWKHLDFVVENICYTSYQLCRGQQSESDFDLVKPFISPLCHLITSSNHDGVIAKSCMSLHAILNRPTKQVRDVAIDDGLILRLANLLQQHSLVEGRHQVFKLVATLLGKAFAQTLPKSVLPIILSDMNSNAAFTIVYRVIKYSKGHIPTLIAQGCIDILCGTFVAKGKKIIKIALSSLAKVSDA